MMNKPAAIGFVAGVVFLAAVLLVYGGSMQQKKTQTTATTADARVSSTEESAETDSSVKPTEKKMVDFKPNGLQSPKKPEVATGGLTMGRSAAPGGYHPGQALDVIVSLDYQGGDKVTALAVAEHLPKGWTFQEVSGGEIPNVVPAKGATGEVAFVWVKVPAFPCTLSYKVLPGPDVLGPQEISGQGVFRQMGPELRSALVKTTVLPATP